MTPFKKIAAGALLLVLGCGCDRYGDGLIGTPPGGSTSLLPPSSFSYDITRFPDVSATFTLNSDAGPVVNLQLGDVAVVTREFDVAVTTSSLTVTGVRKGPDPAVITQLTKDPLLAGTYSLRFRTKTSGYWNFTIGFDSCGLKSSVDSFLNHDDTTTPYVP